MTRVFQLKSAVRGARIGLVAFASLLLMGCDLLGIKEASRSVSEVADQIGTAQRRMSADARHMENTFKDVISDLKKTQHELLVRDLQGVLDRSIQNLGAEGRCSVDYTFRKLHGQLELVRRAILRADAEIQMAKYDRKAELTDYLKHLRVEEYFPPPEVCTRTPATVDVVYTKYTGKARPRQPVIASLSGYGFEAINRKKASLAFFVDGSPGGATTDTWRTSGRQVTPRAEIVESDKKVEIDLSGIEFTREDRRLVVVCDDPDLHPRCRKQLTAFIITVSEEEGIPKPTDWAAIGWRVTFETNRHKKEEAGLFNVKLIFPNHTDTRNDLGKDQFWPDPSKRVFPPQPLFGLGKQKQMNYDLKSPIPTPGKTLVRFQVELRPRPGDGNIDWGGTVHFIIAQQRTVFAIEGSNGVTRTETRDVPFSTKPLYYNAEKVTEPGEQKGKDHYEIEVAIPD